MNDKKSSSLIDPNDWIKSLAFEEEEEGEGGERVLRCLNFYKFVNTVVVPLKLISTFFVFH